MTKELVQKLILAVLVMGGFTYAYLSYGFWPVYLEIQETQTIIHQKEEYLVKLHKDVQDVEKLSARVQVLEEEYSSLKNQIPAVLDKPQLIVYFYNLSQKYHLGSGQLQFEGSEQKGSYSTMTMTYSAAGNVGDILDFIDVLQTTMDPRITVQSVSLSPGVDSAKLTLKLIGYADTLGANAQGMEFMNSSFGVTLPEVLAK